MPGKPHLSGNHRRPDVFEGASTKSGGPVDVFIAPTDTLPRLITRLETGKRLTARRFGATTSVVTDARIQPGLSLHPSSADEPCRSRSRACARLIEGLNKSALQLLVVMVLSESRALLAEDLSPEEAIIGSIHLASLLLSLAIFVSMPSDQAVTDPWWPLRCTEVILRWVLSGDARQCPAVGDRLTVERTGVAGYASWRNPPFRCRDLADRSSAFCSVA